MIKEILNESQLKNSLEVIRDSFRTVALDFKLNQNNCPTHPSFTTIDKLKELRNKGAKFFGSFVNEMQVGFVSIEKSDKRVYYMERLAVPLEHRHKGYGKELVEFVFEYVRNNNGKTLSIGIINEHEILKNWYVSMGFRGTGIKEFPHLPFTVCFMEKDFY